MFLHDKLTAAEALAITEYYKKNAERIRERVLNDKLNTILAKVKNRAEEGYISYMVEDSRPDSDLKEALEQLGYSVSSYTKFNYDHGGYYYVRWGKV